MIFQYDWTQTYINEEELRKDFRIPITVPVTTNMWITNGKDYTYIETSREFWRVYVYNNRDPRPALQDALRCVTHIAP